MNAYELADELENLYNRFLPAHSKFMDIERSANMLRQQADRIAELEKDLHMLQRHYDQLAHDVPSNEPVAWILGIRLKEGFTECLVTREKEGNADIPLYTAPQIKELSDEEIKQLWKPLPDTKYYDSDILNFARAILKKANEK